MKLKIALLATLLTIAGVASAQSSVTLVYGVQEAVPSTTQSHITNFVGRTTAIKDVLTVDAGIYTTTADVARTITNRYEIGATGGYNFTQMFRGDVRVATGMKAVSAKDDFGYYSVEPGINAKFGDFTGRVAYRFRTAYDSNVNADTSNTMRYSVGYNVTKQDRVSVGYDRLRGDGANNSTTVAYTRSF
jgi:hypothetical protein